MSLLGSVIAHFGQSSAENQFNAGIRNSRKSYQDAYDDSKAMVTPYIEPGKNAYGDWATALSGDLGGFDSSAYGKSAVDYAMGKANDALEQSAASRGMLKSGATAKAIQENSQQMAAADYNNRITQYLQQMANLGGASSANSARLEGYRNQLGEDMASLDQQAAGIAAQGKLNKYNNFGSGIQSLNNSFVNSGAAFMEGLGSMGGGGGGGMGGF
ncbi:hypothetical protein FACS1894186_4920 [Alphaproteobacteria bacterium]|nr:hypothetical protein FACS1894186_4920 [Alphaproteobacteria bacterium]